MLKAVIFDMDDTLLKTKQTKYKALKYLGKHFYNIDVSEELLGRHWGKPFNEFVRLIYGDIDSIENIKSQYYKVTIEKFPNQPYEDAIDVVNELYPKYKLGILSSAPKHLVVNDLEVSGFSLSRFSYIQSADDTVFHKPDFRVFEPLLKFFLKFGIQPNEMLFTGDTLYDYHAASGAGLTFIGMAGRTASIKEFKNAGTESVNNLIELKQYVFTS